MQLSNAIAAYLLDLEEQVMSDATIENAMRFLGYFADWLGDKPLGEITRLDEARYFRYEEKRGLADGSLAAFRSCHHAFWNFCDERGWCEGNLVSRVKRYSDRPVRRKPAPEEDVRAVAEKLPAYAAHRDHAPIDVRNALIVSMSIDSGCRRGALWHLTNEAMQDALANPLETEAGQLAYVARSTGKTGPCSIVFFAATAAFYQDWRELQPRNATYVFTSVRSGKRMARNTLGLQLTTVCRWCGVKPFSTQGVRKTNISGVVRLSDLAVGQEYAGHSSIDVTRKHYYEPNRQQVVSAAAELNARRRDADVDEMARFFGIL